MYLHNDMEPSSVGETRSGVARPVIPMACDPVNLFVFPQISIHIYTYVHKTFLMIRT